MKLYLYDHCPFCVRVEMVAHYKEIPFQTVYLLNDDEQTCYRLVNAKQVPILEFDDGTAMPESLDIAIKFDIMGNAAKTITPKNNAETIIKHIDTAADASRCLLFPRDIMLDLPEFATQSAKDYFRAKKEATIKRPFEQAMQETEQHKAAVETMLATLPQLPEQENGSLSWDDVLIYPMLRNLTMIKKLHFPQPVLGYINNVSHITKTQTYFNRAI